MTITSCSVRLLFVFVLVASSTGVKAREGSTMNEQVMRKIEETAAKDNGWNRDDVRVEEIERLRRPACSFFSAGHKVRPLSYLSNYALLSGTEIVGSGDGNVVAKIVDSCANGASADWWAEIVTRFHQDLGDGIVLRDEQTRPDIVRKLREAGKTFAPPVLDPQRRSLRYLLLDPEAYVLYQVQATRSDSGPIEVVENEVL
jgi:hypothetical protein